MKRYAPWLAGLVAVAVVVGAFIVRSGNMYCGTTSLTPEVLEQAEALGARYLDHHQRHDGRFVAAADWRDDTDVEAHDHSIRQAAALWALARAYRRTPNPELRQAIDEALAFWRDHTTSIGSRTWTVYPDEHFGYVGTSAALALTHVELIRASPSDAAASKKQLQRHAAQIREAQRDDGLFWSAQRVDTGEPFGHPAAEPDSLALLALVSAAEVLQAEDLRSAALDAALAGHRRYVLEAPVQSEHETADYFPAAAAAWFSLADHSGLDDDRHGAWLIDQAVWVTETQKIRGKAQSGKFFEGIVLAWEWGQRTGDPRARQLSCMLDIGLVRYISRQVGHPLAQGSAQAASESDPDFAGGVTGPPSDSPIRLEYVQHLLSAVGSTREHYSDGG